MKRSIENILHHSEVSEKAIEKYLVEKVKTIGGVCLKYSNPNMDGYPDRLVVLPGGRTSWVELKSKNKKPTKLQMLRHKQLADMGHNVNVVDSKNNVDYLISIWEGLK